MSRGYIKVSVGPGLNLRPSISFVDRTRIEADGQQLTKDAEQKFTMILSKKVFAPKKEYIEWAMNKLPDTHFTPEDMEYIYTNLGNGIRHELCMKFVQSNYDLGVIDEGLQEKDGPE